MIVYKIELLLGCSGILIGLLVNHFAEFLPRRYGKTVTTENTMYTIQDKWSHKRIRKILVMVLYVIFTITIWSASRNILDFVLTLSLFVYLGLIFIIDLEHWVILDTMIIFGIVLGTVFGIHLNGIVSTLQGGAVGFLVLLVLYYFGKWLMPYLAHLRHYYLDKQALYKNDIFLGLILGLILGCSGVINGLLIALLLICSAGILSIFYTIVKHKYDPNLAIPLGPFMVLGVVISFLINDVF